MNAIERFWDAYGRGYVLRMTRNPIRGYTGASLNRADRTMAADISAEVTFDLPLAEITTYDFDSDPHFSLGIHLNFSDSLAAVVSARLMEQDTIPHRRQMVFVLSLLGESAEPSGPDYRELRNQVVSELSRRQIFMESVVQRMLGLLPGREQAEKFRQTGNLAPLHTEREVLLKAFALQFSSPSISEAIRMVIDNCQNEDWVTVGLAIWSLGRQCRHSDAEYLLGLLGNPRLSRHRLTIERALQFLLSGEVLEPFAPESSYAQDHWRVILSRRPPGDDALGWARIHASSVLWEKRLRCAVQWSAANHYPELVESFRTDEVPVVRRAVGVSGPVTSLVNMSGTQLLTASFRGNDQAFSLFCERFLPALQQEIGIRCRSAGLPAQTLDELFAEGVARLVSHIRTRSADAPEISNTIAWLKALGRNVFMDFVSKVSSKEAHLTHIHESAEPADAEDTERASLEDYELIESYFAKLTPQQSEVMRLIHIEQLTIAQVAERMRVSRDAVYKAQERALKALRNMVPDEF